MNVLEKKSISAYRDLLRRFVEAEITAPEFEKEYLRVYKIDPLFYPEPIHIILAKLFSDVDAYCSTPEIRDDDDLDEAQLLERVKNALRALSKAELAD